MEPGRFNLGQARPFLRARDEGVVRCNVMDYWLLEYMSRNNLDDFQALLPPRADLTWTLSDILVAAMRVVAVIICVKV